MKKASKKIGLLRRIRRRVPSLVLRSMYLTCIRPVLEYACGSWGGLTERNTQRLERVQRSAARLIAGVSVTDHLPHDILLARAGLETLARRRDMILVAPVYHLTRQTPSGPRHLCEAFERWKEEAPSSRCSMPLRSAELHHVRLPRPRTELLRRSPFYRAVSLLNSFPPEVKASWSSLKSAILSFS